MIWWSLLSIPPSFVTGLATAFLLLATDRVTTLRLQHPFLVFLLPLFGYISFWLLSTFKEKSSPYTLQGLQQPLAGVSTTSALPVFLATVLTQLGGASAGRAGACFQIGASIGRRFAHLFHLEMAPYHLLVSAGVAAAFGAAFGAPVAGAIFALEVIPGGYLPYNALLPCLAAGVCGLAASMMVFNIPAHNFFTGHHFLPALATHVDIALLGKAVMIGIVIGLLCVVFTVASQYTGKVWVKSRLPHSLVPVIGGALLLALSFVGHNTDYLGLGILPGHPGIPALSTAFSLQSFDHWSWLWKLLFTVITLSCGFRGGEITPLLFVGVAMGSLFAPLLSVPISLVTALCLVAVIAGAANTPLAAIFLGIECFGGQQLLYYVFASFAAYTFSPLKLDGRAKAALMPPKLFDLVFIRLYFHPENETFPSKDQP
jgi:H+/Cl- antiporter ClcA